MRSRLNSLRTAHMNMAKELEVLKANNARAEYLKSKVNQADEYLTFVVPYIEGLNKLLTVTKDEYAKYQEKRIHFIENSLSDNIAKLFPNEYFIPKILYSLERNNIRSELILIDEDKNERHPRITEGGFMQELIAFTSSIKVLELLGSKTFYLDEAFSKASTINKERMSEVIKGYIDEGLQMILISQSSECYQDLPRREFILEKKDKVCNILDVKDFE